MDRILKAILTLFESFVWIEYETDSEFKKIIEWDFDKISFNYFNQVKIIERQLKGLFLIGNDVTLSRIRSELQRIKETLTMVDFGFIISIHGQDWEGVKQLTIEPEALHQLNSIKLMYIDKLLLFIDDRIHVKSRGGINKKHRAKKEKLLENYLNNEGKKILPKIIMKYKNSKPAEIAYLWHAMNDLTLIERNISNNSELHRLLTVAFGNIGTLQPFASHMKKLGSDRTTFQDGQISLHLEKIKDLQHK